MLLNTDAQLVRSFQPVRAIIRISESSFMLPGHFVVSLRAVYSLFQ
jgi:hypothetical protein